MPNAPEVVITPAPKLLGNPALTMAGSKIEPMATTVAGLEPDTAANRAQASTPAQAQATVPVADHAGGKIDHAPRHPAVGQKVARQNEERDRHDLELLNAGEQLERHRLQRHIGKAKQKGQDRRPNEIEIGMPVSISTISRIKIMAAFMGGFLLNRLARKWQPRQLHRRPPARVQCGWLKASVGVVQVTWVQAVGHGIRVGIHRKHVVFHAIDMAVVMVGQLAGADKVDQHLQKAKTHQAGAQGNGAVDHPGGHSRSGVVGPSGITVQGHAHQL
jgi:hypothetical protein